MKVLAIALAIFLTGGVLKAQNFFHPDYREKEQFSIALKNVNTRSIRGWKSGVSVNLEFKDRFEVGYVYLSALNNSDGINDVYSGVQSSLKFSLTNRLQIGGGFRVGTYNKDFIHFLPSVRAEVKVTKAIFTEFAYAHSDGFPFFEMNLGIKLIKK